MRINFLLLFETDENDQISKAHDATTYNFSNSHRTDQTSELDSVLAGLEFSSDNICKLAHYIKGIGDKRQQLKTFSMWIQRQSKEEFIHSETNDSFGREFELLNITAHELNGDNIRKLVLHVRGIHEDVGQLRNFFERMERQLEDERTELISLHHPEMNITKGDYVKDEEEITKTLLMLYRYLNDTQDESIRNDFFQQVAILPSTLNSLINGLRGDASVPGDIMVDLVEAVQVKVLKFLIQLFGIHHILLIDAVPRTKLPQGT